MQRYDLALTDDFDLAITNGDFAVEPSDNRHVAELLLTAPGHWRFNPTAGVDLIRFIGSPDAYKSAIENGLREDGYQVTRIDVTDIANPIIDAAPIR